MLNLSLIIINSTICWYLISLLIVEKGRTISGPFSKKEVSVGGYLYCPGLFDLLRIGAYKKITFTKEGSLDEWEININSLFSCPYCLGFWVSVSIVVIEYFSGLQTSYPIIDVFASVAGANLLYIWSNS